MNRVLSKRNSGINGNALRTWAILFLAAGIMGRGVIQTHMLGIGHMNNQQILQVLGSSDVAMTMTTLSLVLQALEVCAVPIFGLLLMEGIQYTSDFNAYLLRVGGLAVLCEIPYNLAFGGKLLFLKTRNPVFALVICMVMIRIYQFYADKGMKTVVVDLLVTAAAVVWCEMLKIDFGSPIVLISAVLWGFRVKPLYRNFAGASMAMVCSMISPFFLACPMSFLIIHAYNGENGTNSRLVNYLAYPVLLLIGAAGGMLL